MALILTCDQCQTNYYVPPSSIPDKGRKVKCTICGHLWHQMPPNKDETATLTSTQPDIDIISPPKKPSITSLEKKRLKTNTILQKLCAIAVFVICVFSLFAFRYPIMEAMPETTRLYSVFGLGYPKIVYFETLESKHFTANKNIQYNLTGMISNKGILPIQPFVTLTLLDKNKQPLVELGRKHISHPIKPQSHGNFNTMLTNVPKQAHYVRLNVSK